MMKRWFVAALVLAAGCREATGTEERIVEGRYALGWEIDYFQPCGSSENWLALATREVADRYFTLARPPGAPVYARFRGTAGPRGKFGMYGANDREFQVAEVLEMRPLAASDCD